ncbi:MAG: sigma-70 family RNA polymerase sigma factor [Lachnospiraceae bacterium]|nr:sigma-70 family RNA polymerase sigma factor [Lachnospiraceae bacterium]
MDSMEQIYKMHAQTVYGFLLSRTGNPDLAEELTQETFYRAVKSIGRFKGDSSVSTWLCGIAKKLMYEQVRKEKKQESLDAGGEIPDNAALEGAVLKWDSMEVVRLLHNLEEPMREVMYLRLIGNLSFAQIGEIMERSENWARVTFYRGKEKILKEAEK